MHYCPVFPDMVAGGLILAWRLQCTGLIFDNHQLVWGNNKMQRWLCCNQQKDCQGYSLRIYFFTDGNFQVEDEVNTCLLQIIELKEVSSKVWHNPPGCRLQIETLFTQATRAAPMSNGFTRTAKTHNNACRIYMLSCKVFEVTLQQSWHLEGEKKALT